MVDQYPAERLAARAGIRSSGRIAAPIAGPIVGIAAAACPQVAAAQAAPEPRMEVRADLFTRYEENVARSSDAIANARGIRGSDVILAPTLTVDIERPFGGKHRASLTGQVGYEIYRRNDQLSRERINLTGNADLRVGPCFVSPTVRFSRRQTDLGDLALVGGGFLAVKNTETVQTYGTELGCGGERGLRPFVGIEYEKGDNSAVIRQRSDYEATMYSVGLRYVGPTLGVITLYGRRRKTEFDPLPVPGFGQESYRNTEIGASYARNIGSRIQASGSIGRSKIESANPLIRNRSGMTWSLRASVLVGSRVQLVVDTRSDFRNSLASDATVNRTRSHGASISYAATEVLRLNASARVDRQTRDYGFAVPAGTLISDTRQTYRVGATYDFGRRTRFGVGVGREKRNGNGTFYDYSANNAYMSVGIRF